MSLRAFAERTIILEDGQPFRLAGRPYLIDVYESTAPQLVIRASRQVEKTTLLCNLILYHAVRTPGLQILFVSPRREQARIFSKVRLAGVLRNSLILRRLLWPYARALPPVDISFSNGSNLFIRSAYHSADPVRGIAASMLVIDEFQDLAAGELPVLQETLSHAASPRLVLVGTPKLIDNHLEVAFNSSLACEWTVECARCHQVALMDERILTPLGLTCASCQLPLDSSAGRWVARNPHSTWGSGFWINHLMVPWVNQQEICNRQQTYDPVRFQNEVLGLPVSLGDHLITRQEIEACCEQRPFANTLAEVSPAARRRIVAGLDWGGGGVAGTVLVLGYVERGRVFRVVRMDKWKPYTDPNAMMDEIARRCTQFGVCAIAADGGGFGLSHNRLLLGRMQGQGRVPAMYALFYADADHEPVRDGVLWRWTVSRSGSIGNLFARIKKKLLRFPKVDDSGSFLDEFLCETAVYDEDMRRIRYTKPETHRDDAMHATNYCQLIGLRMPESSIA